MINVSGSFILGVLFAVLVQRNVGSHDARRADAPGAYTTFSTFSLETFRLFEDGATGSALANIASVGVARRVARHLAGRASDAATIEQPERHQVAAPASIAATITPTLPHPAATAGRRTPDRR